MKTGAFWKADWFVGLLIAAAFLVAAGGSWMQGLERQAYDAGVRLSSATPSDRVAVIAIDDQSIANIGRWPWSREVMARMTELLAGAGAKVIANTVFFLEPQQDPGLGVVSDLLAFYGTSSLSQPPAGTSLNLVEDLGRLGHTLRQADDALNTDRKLAASLEHAGNVALAMPFLLGLPQGRPDNPLPDYLRAAALTNLRDDVHAYEHGERPLPARAVLPPIPELASRAAALGHLNSTLDVDGGVRAVPLVVDYFDEYFPSLALAAVARSLNLKEGEIEVRLGEGVRLGNLTVRTDPQLQLYPLFYHEPAFPVDSFFDVLSGKIPASKYKGKIVLLGATATGVGTPQPTPVSPAMAPVLILAHTVSSILNEQFFILPEWGTLAKYGALLLVTLYLTLALPRLKAGPAAAVTALFFVALIAAHFSLMVGSRTWLQLMAPATLLLLGHALLTTKRYLLTERSKEKVEADSAETNKMLGLAFQGQGQLDMAFEKFRKCAVDDALLDLLYNLSLDYERKRQFNKAGAVYRYIAEHNPKFRDIEIRMKRSDQLENTVMLGAAGASPTATVIAADGTVEKPMLGRYEVEKELGKGAMGVVYLGRDPKINRTVAIKTMALSQEFDEEELADVKERFFREAETAGRLNHPMIVSIFDAGEEHDLAYIAMEFLKGKDLTAYAKPDALLPIMKVFEICMKVAMALDYAHRQNVVHRDIKPANIMYEVENGNLKVTDFGIARITDSSKTKTGMVLGTPSYMSPEQLAGKKVDGRSDLFSLAVMSYQLFTGRLPFQGDSMAALMFKIANEPHPDPRKLRPELPPCLSTVLEKGLAKDPGERYQTGRDLAVALRACAGEYVAAVKARQGK